MLEAVEGHLAAGGLGAAEPALRESWGLRALLGCGEIVDAASGRGVGQGADALPRCEGVLAARFPLLHQRGDVGEQSVHAGIRVRPTVREGVGVEGAQPLRRVEVLEQGRGGRHQEADRELDRRNVAKQAALAEELDLRDVVVEGGPRGEGHQGRLQGDSRLVQDLERLGNVRGRVALAEPREDVVGCGLNCRDHEAAAGLGEAAEVGAMLQDVLDLRGEVVGHVGILVVERLGHATRVARAVQEVRIGEADVACAGGNLGAHVGQDGLGRHGEEAAAVDRNHGAVAAEVQTPTAGLDRAGDDRASVLDVAGVSGEGGSMARWGVGKARRSRIGVVLRVRVETPGADAGSRPSSTARTRPTRLDSNSPARTESAGPASNDSALSHA